MMSKEKRRVPKLRFPGFTEDWEQRKADYIFKSITDKGYPELPVLSASQELGMVYRDQNGIDIQHDKKNETSYKRVLPGQFVIHLRSFQGGFAYSEVEGITSPAYTVMSFKNSSEQYGLFWKHVFKSERFIKRLETITYGIRDGRSISFSDFKSLILQYPSFSEQKLIGDSIAVLEKGITLHQRKLDNLKLKKKALLQKLFPKNGERYPELRFPEFTDAWEQRKLSDITEIVMGQSPSSKNYTDNPNDNILVQGNADLKDGKVVPRLWTKEITKTIDKDGIILTVRAPVGDVARTDYKVVLGRGVAGIKGNDYIYQFLQKLQNNRYWVSLSSGSTFESINSNDIKDLIIDIPSIEEQTKISMLLNNVNSIITLHQQEPFLCGNSVNIGGKLCSQ